MKSFIARQPILDAHEKIYGYELLFRSGMEEYFRATDADQASSRVIADSFLTFGIHTLTHGLPAFVNLTRSLLVRDHALVPFKEQVVYEILETIEPDAEVRAACTRLRRHGYRLALDDFVPGDRRTELVDLVDFVKVDFRLTPPEERPGLAKSLSGGHRVLVAEKVESWDEFREALDSGYHCAQGFFYRRAEVMVGRSMPPSRLNYLRLIRAVNSPEPDFALIEEGIKHEPALCYRLLRYLNSPLFGFVRDITSIRHAISLMGINEIRRWASLVALAGLGDEKPKVLVVCSVTRAKHCEMIGSVLGLRNLMDFFLVGLLSLADALLEMPMTSVLQQLALSPELQAALTGEDNLLQRVLQAAIDSEHGDWDAISRSSALLALSEESMADTYLKAVEWGNQIFELDESA